MFNIKIKTITEKTSILLNNVISMQVMLHSFGLPLKCN